MFSNRTRKFDRKCKWCNERVRTTIVDEKNLFPGLKPGRKRRFILNVVPNDMPLEALRKMCINFNKAQQQGRIYMNKKLGYNDRFVKASEVNFSSSRRSKLADKGNSYIIENRGETSENRQNNDI
tara:strand:+ start:573 stop:947 length:375 start_codon:yes stop_codon:yes gene_type:complete